MTPATTHSSNAKLGPTEKTRRRRAGDLGFAPSPIQSSSPPVRIVGAAARYRGGYHLSI